MIASACGSDPPAPAHVTFLMMLPTIAKSWTSPSCMASALLPPMSNVL
jgi:hypothetical protein